MPQPLKDIGERIELLQMTLSMFVPSEPGPVAAELLQLGEEILEHALIAGGERLAAPAGDSTRLRALLAQCQRMDPAFTGIEAACRELLACHDQVIAAPDDADHGVWLVDEARAGAALYSFVAARQAR